MAGSSKCALSGGATPSVRKSCRGLQQSMSLREALCLLECGSPLPLLPPAEPASPSGGAKSCRGLQDYRTINLIGSVPDQIHNASRGRKALWSAETCPEHYPQVARATVRILQGFEVGEKGGEVATGSAALYRAFSPGWENGCLPGVVTPGWDGTHRRCLSPKGLRPTTKRSIGH